MGAAFQEVHEGVQVPRRGVGVEQGGLEPEAAVGGGSAQYGGAALEEGAAQGGQCGVVGVGGPEQDGADGGRRVEFEGGVCFEESGELFGAGAGAVDEVGEAVSAEGAQGGGDFEGVCAAGGAQGAAEEVGQAGLGVVGGVEVVGLVGEGASRVVSGTVRSPAAMGCQPSLWRSMVIDRARWRPASLGRWRGLRWRRPP